MAGQTIIKRDQLPDDFQTLKFVVNVNQATGTKEALCVFDKRTIIDAIDVVGLKVGAAKTVQLYAVPVGQDIQGTPGAAATPYLHATSVDLNASTWTNAEGTASTATTTATGWASPTIDTTTNVLEAGTILAVVQTGSAASGKNPVVSIRFRTRYL